MASDAEWEQRRLALSRMFYSREELYRGGGRLGSEPNLDVSDSWPTSLRHPGEAGERINGHAVLRLFLLEELDPGLNPPSAEEASDNNLLLSGYSYAHAAEWILGEARKARIRSLRLQQKKLAGRLREARRRVDAACRVLETHTPELMWFQYSTSADEEGEESPEHAAAFDRVAAAHEALRIARQPIKRLATARDEAECRHEAWLKLMEDPANHGPDRRYAQYHLFAEFMELTRFYNRLIAGHPATERELVDAALPVRDEGGRAERREPRALLSEGKEEPSSPSAGERAAPSDDPQTRIWRTIHGRIRAGQRNRLPKMECSICLGTMWLTTTTLPLRAEDDGARHDGIRLHCDHLYCEGCLLRHLDGKFEARCPLCREPFTRAQLRDSAKTRNLLEATMLCAADVPEPRYAVGPEMRGDLGQALIDLEK